MDDDFEQFDAPQTRRTLATVLFLIALIVAGAFVSAAYAAHEGLCVGLADYGITAAALAKQERAGRISRPVADAVLSDMYDSSRTNPPQVNALYARVRNAADTTRSEPNEFAQQLLDKCIAVGGNPDLFLGVAL